MNVSAQQIYDECAESALLLGLMGNKNAIVSAISPYQNSTPGDLVFVPDEKALKSVIDQGAAAIITTKKLAEKVDQNHPTLAILICANIGIAHAIIKQKYGDHDYSQSGWDRIHSTAIVHDSVVIPENTSLGPNVIIEKGSKIGNGCHLMANVTIEHNAIIGDNVRIHPNTIIGWECEIGNETMILSNTVIGGEGFGYAQDQYFNHHRIPQTGNVIIGKKVTIGANCTIDRGTYGATIIGDGCIFDNICHVAHNVTMGKNCIILSGFLCAGSTTIGDRVVASGGAMIKDHVNICDDVYLMHRAGVIKDIKEKGMYAGSPVQPMKEYVINNAIYKRLGELRNSVIEMRRSLNGKI